MADSISSLDTTSNATLAIAKLVSGRTFKFPKVKPSGASDANDAAWQARAEVEHLAAINNVQSGGANATALLTSLV